MATKMFSLKRALLYAFLLAVLLEPISGRKSYSGSHSSHSSYGGGRHSGGLSGGHSSGGHGYPSSGGSHGGSHGYPSSSGLSGTGSKPSYPSSGGLSGGSHSYPSSGGLSGGSHSYPSSGGLSGGSHSYPSSGGLSGTGSKPSYPSSGGMSGGSHSYPTSGGMSESGTHNKYPHSSGTYPTSSGNHNYPSSNSGLSGSGSSNRYPQKPVVHHTTTHTVHHHYHYAPPQQISYTPVRGGATVYYPVYHQTPPSYVYTYKNSDSKYGTLLAGLALFNLGALAGNAYAHSGNSGSRTHYTPQPGEVCKFAVKKENGDYEETKIDCQIISSFIYQDLAQTRPGGTNITTSVVTVTNTTITNTSNMMPQGAMTPPPAAGNVLYTMLPNGTLVPVNMTGVPVSAMPLNATQNVSQQLAANGVLTSSVVTTTTTNTTLVNALDVKGKPVTVTPGMECFVIRNSPTHNMRKVVPCGLLQTYADKSIQRNAAARNGPMFTVAAAILAFCLVY